MDGSVEFGLHGVGLEPGDHICALYLGTRERDEVLLPYLRQGLRSGDKCLGVVDATAPSAVLEKIGGEIDVETCVASEQLEVRTAEDAYLRLGRFSTDEMLGFCEECVGSALREGRFGFARVAGEAGWAIRSGSRDEVIRDESALNRLTPSHPQTVLGLYDLNGFGGGSVVDMLKTHPKVMLGGMLLENPHYLTPYELLPSRS